MEDNKVIRVAQIICKSANGGVESCIINYYRHIDKTKIQFDFFVENECDLINREEIEKMGGKIIIVPKYKHMFKFINFLKKELRGYDIVHSNINTLSVFSLYAAKKAGVKIRIAHSHSTTNKKEKLKNIVKNVLKPFSKLYATHYFACGKLAGEWLFGEKERPNITIVNNSINIDKFKYNEEYRNVIRKKYNLNDKFVIGHVGRFMKQKNHQFILETFLEVSKKRNDAVLLLIGEGPLIDESKEFVKNNKLDDKVIFAGSQSEVYKFYNAFDCFILPSLYEGLPVVGIEAQVNGITCLFSDNVTSEAGLLKTTKFLALDKDLWVNKLTNLNPSTHAYDLVMEKYNIDVSAKKLAEKYISIYEEMENSKNESNK